MEFYVTYLNILLEENLIKLVRGKFFNFFYLFFIYFCCLGRYLRIFQPTSKMKDSNYLKESSVLKKKILRRECRASKFHGCIHLSNL